jgi:hypothetical protein
VLAYSNQISRVLCEELTMASALFNHTSSPDEVSLQANSMMTNQKYTSELLAFGPKIKRSQLGVDFQPSDLSVICGRGKDSYNHTGNGCFRILASVYVERYSRADCKTAKSAIVCNIVTMIRQAGGHFCKKCENGTWYEVGDRCAREKVSAYFRDMLHTQYRSSTKAKTTLRRVRNRNKSETQAQQQCQLAVDISGVEGICGVDGISGHDSDDSSLSLSCWESSFHGMWCNYSLEIDFFDIEVF